MNQVKLHEFVVEDRMSSFVEYLKTLKPYVVLPSILVCSQTMTLIDGHHRLEALKRLGLQMCPVTFLDYSSDRIITDLDPGISKQEIIDAAETGQLLQPKSSFHHVIDDSGRRRPIILLSQLSDLVTP